MPHTVHEPDELARVSLRLDDGLRRRLADAAAHSVRSLNSEIVYRLRSSFDAGEQGRSEAA
jgi:hypothetical protein